MSRQTLEQGSIIELTDDRKQLLVLSKTFFNESGLCIVCPIVTSADEDALHISVGEEKHTRIALCEHLRTMDLRKRHYRKRGEITFPQIQEVSDAVQSIFDYYPYALM